MQNTIKLFFLEFMKCVRKLTTLQGALMHTDAHVHTDNLYTSLSDSFSCFYVIHISVVCFCCLPFLSPPSISLTHSLFSPYPAAVVIIISLSGLSPAQSEFNYLNTARTLELYGVELHYARVSKVLFSDC